MNTGLDLRELAIDREPSQTGVRTRRHLLTRFVLPLVLMLGFLWLVAWASRDLVFPPKEVTVVPVFATTTEIRQEGTPLFKAAGWIEPRPTPVRVAALSPGVVKQLLVVEDQTVKAGQPIAELVKDDAELEYQRALADLELRQAELDQSKAGLEAAETRFKQPVHLQALLGEAEAALAKTGTRVKNLPFELRRAEADYEALKQVYEGKRSASGVVPGVEIDIAKGKLTSAQAFVEELRKRSGSLEKEQTALSERQVALETQLELLADEIKARDEAKAKVRGSAARVAQMRVAVAQAQLQFDRMTVVSPIDGRVFRLIAHPGARIGSGMAQMTGHDGSTVVTLYRPEMLQVRVDVRFEDIPKVRLNQLVEIGNAALSATLTGNVLYISSEADIQKNTLQVKVEIVDPPSVLKPEMLVDVTFLSPKAKSPTLEGDGPERDAGPARLFVLRQFVGNEEGASFVWVADRSANAARKQEIQIGNPGENGLVEVLQGLNVSSRIIASGADGLTDGCRIRVIGEPADSPANF